MRLFSPAKINLFLRVLSGRQDGYHEIASLFQAVSWGDCLHFELSDRDFLSSTDPTLPLGENNLIMKAAHLFRQKSGLRFFFKAHIEKKIPLGAGLGGGSSNAATTLFALNELTHHPFTEQQLQQLAGEVGSDVAFFFSSGTAYCTGRGENVESLSPLCQISPLWLVKPPFALSTQEVYRSFRQERASLVDPRELLSHFLSGKIYFVNDLEEPAFLLSPSLSEIKKKILSQGYEKVSLTGSGSGILVASQTKPLLDPSIAIYPLSFCQRDPSGWYHLLV